jgi:predicted ATPase
LKSRTPDPLDTLIQCESVRLFIDRAQAVRADFQVTPANAAAVAALCMRLEGLPLALELAAARVRILTPQQMLSRLEQRFELLVSRREESTASSAHHRSLRAALDWSYHLLSPELQSFFARLSLFRGGFTLEAAEAVCAADDAGGGTTLGVDESLAPAPPASPITQGSISVLDCLEQLRECSLLLLEESDDEMRYRLLETLREYAAEQLTAGERLKLAARHAAYYRDLAERAEPELWGAEQGAWLERLEREHDNLRAALSWAEESSEAEAGLRLAGALWEFWAPRGHLVEGRERLTSLLALPGAAAHPTVRAKALACAGVLAQFQSDYPVAQAFLLESLEMWRELDDRWGAAFSLTALGFVARSQGEYTTARRLQEEALAIWRELGHRNGVAWSLNNIAAIAGHQGDYDAECALHQESLALRRALGDQWGAAFSLSSLGRVGQSQGDLANARSYYEESLTIRRALGDRAGIATSLTNLGNVTLLQGQCEAGTTLLQEGLAIRQELGDPGGVAESLCSLGVASALAGDRTKARALLEDSLAIRRDLGDKEGLAECLEKLAGLEVMLGCAPRGARLLGAAAGLRERLGTRLPPADRLDHERRVAEARAALGEAEFSREWDAGRALNWQQAAAFALGQVFPPT